ncbi:hypothetical protein M427DRAFT_26940 [Gonapodya prolifera JEL478]|uniref:Uncharacterized protein n=1 Tax=Gonapodya prolifera (strain JEL478) TaxID=1344416 RepID=A0A139B070_GONPJ|nr:hypothetical protein M427DRAFT_26940 [Gonapodya prolifera JEL478]|eukprot:KXS22369.1 hypothetical protein M427DRAFT_26940 [Gonapodya prolifera JEL478]
MSSVISAITSAISPSAAREETPQQAVADTPQLMESPNTEKPTGGLTLPLPNGPQASIPRDIALVNRQREKESEENANLLGGKHADTKATHVSPKSEVQVHDSQMEMTSISQVVSDTSAPKGDATITTEVDHPNVEPANDGNKSKKREFINEPAHQDDMNIGPAMGSAYWTNIAQVFKDEIRGRADVVTRKLDEVRQNLDEQMQIGVRHYEDVLDRQIADIVALEQRERKLRNEVTFLRARLDRALREGDRVSEIEHSKRERELLDVLRRREAILTQHDERVASLQEALDSTLARIDTEVRKKEIEDRKRAEEALREAHEDWEEKFDKARKLWNREKSALARELNELRGLKQKHDEVLESLSILRRRNRTSEAELARLRDELKNSRANEERLRERLEDFEDRERQWTKREADKSELEFLRINYKRLLEADRKHIDELNKTRTSALLQLSSEPIKVPAAETVHGEISGRRRKVSYMEPGVQAPVYVAREE